MAGNGYSLISLDDFRGGLNYRTDVFDLELNESPDLLNVTVDARGGILLRDGVKTLAQTALASNVNGIWSYHNDDGTSKVLVNYGTTVAVYDGTDFDSTGAASITARTDGSRTYGVTINNVAYAVSGDVTSFYYNGTSFTNLGTTLDGSAGNFPIAQYVEHWNNFAWVGNTVEGGTAQKNRIRFSNANLPTQWNDLDYIDIGKGEGGDYITGVVGHNDRLVIFKSNSMYALFGFDADTFQLVPISETVGSIPLSKPVSTPYGVFFWHDRKGVYLYNGDTTVWLFDKLQPAIDDGRIAFGITPQLAWANNKLYVTVQYNNPDTYATEQRMLVYDPTTNAWVMWDVDALVLHAHQPPNAEAVLYGACVANTGRVVSIDNSDFSGDRYTYDSGSGNYVTTNIPSYFRTAWIKTKNPIVKKRWGQIRLIIGSETTVNLGVDVFHDYDPSTERRQYTTRVEGRGGSTSTWAADAAGTTTWQDAAGTTGNGTWATFGGSAPVDIKKLGTGGTAASICVKLVGPTVGFTNWEVNGLAFPYISRRMR